MSTQVVKKRYYLALTDRSVPESINPKLKRHEMRKGMENNSAEHTSGNSRLIHSYSSLAYLASSGCV